MAGKQQVWWQEREAKAGILNHNHKAEGANCKQVRLFTPKAHPPARPLLQ